MLEIKNWKKLLEPSRAALNNIISKFEDGLNALVFIKQKHQIFNVDKFQVQAERQKVIFERANIEIYQYLLIFVTEAKNRRLYPGTKRNR